MLKSRQKYVFIFLVFTSQYAFASFHLWDISEVYSNDDGTVQYIELTCSVNGQQFLNNHEMTATSDGNTVEFIFNANSGSPTLNKKLLIATSNFSSLLGSVEPDFILPDNFINPNASTITVNFGLNQDVMTFAGTDLPSDGLQSLYRNFTTGVNSPTNFVGTTGLINDPDVIYGNGFE